MSAVTDPAASAVATPAGPIVTMTEEVCRVALQVRPKHSAIFYVGEPPDDVIFVL